MFETAVTATERGDLAWDTSHKLFASNHSPLCVVGANTHNPSLLSCVSFTHKGREMMQLINKVNDFFYTFDSNPTPRDIKHNEH